MSKSKQIYIPHNNEERAARLMQEQKPMTGSPSSKQREGGDNCPTRPSLSNAYYVTNRVEGTLRYITILKYDWVSQRSINPKQEMEELSRKYGLSEWFVIRTSAEVYCISLVALDKRRIEKILNSTKSTSKFEFKKFKKIFIRISPINQTEDAPLPSGYLTFKTEIVKDFYYSKPHVKLINHFGFQENPFLKYIGLDEPNVILTTKERGA